MARITCDYCGTEYDDDMQRCPLCGTVNDSVAEPERQEEQQPRNRKTRKKKEPGAFEAADSDRIPRWLSILICVVLGIAVVIGAMYAMYALGVFSPKKEETVQDDTLNLPISDAEQPEDGEEISGQDADQTPPDDAEVLCTGITANPASLQLGSAGISASVMVTVLPSDCTEQIRWETSDPTICTVDSSGIVTAVDGGTATVTATCGDFSTEVEVLCDFSNSKENNASLDLTDFTLFSTGDQAVIHVNDAPANAVITWRSSDTNVCTVSDGVVTAVKGGTATVTADVNGKELTCIVRCRIEGSVIANDDNAEATGTYRLDHTDVTMSVGESFEISVVDGVSGGWNVSDASVISVDANGIVTGLASGTATVYTNVGGQRLECIVRIK